MSGVNFNDTTKQSDNLQNGSRSLEMFDDFIVKYPASGANSPPFGHYMWEEGQNGGSITGMSTESGHPGVIGISVTTLTTDKGYVYTPTFNCFPSFGSDYFVGEWCVRAATLATVPQDYKAGIGFSVDLNITPTVGAFFKYDRSVSPNWLLITANTANGTETQTSSIAVTNGWTKLRLEYKPSTGYLTYFVNGVEAHTTNSNKIPTDPLLDLLGVVFGIEKTAGSEQRDFEVDYSLVQITFGTPR